MTSNESVSEFRILWICFVWPEPDSSAAGTRTYNLLKALNQMGFDVTAVSAGAPSDYQSALEELGVRTARIATNDSGFNDFIRELDPHLVVFDRFMVEEQFSWRVRAECPNALRILDTVDLHFLRKMRERSIPEQSASSLRCESLEPEEISEEILRELASIFRSDLTLLVSSYEIELLSRRYKISADALHRCGLVYHPQPTSEPFEARSNFVAIGNCHHRPNIDSFEVLVRQIWPRIKNSFDDVELHLYGAYPNSTLLNLHSPADRVLVKGKADDAVKTLANYRVNLAPLRFGAGVKGKVADGWAAGTPCIATSIAAEGMGDGDSFGGLIADDIESFAFAATELYQNKFEWTSAQANGIKVLKSSFDLKSQVVALIKKIKDVYARKASVRSSNYCGEIIWREQLRSTEYFSRWIELKSKVS